MLVPHSKDSFAFAVAYDTILDGLSNIESPHVWSTRTCLPGPSLVYVFVLRSSSYRNREPVNP